MKSDTQVDIVRRLRKLVLEQSTSYLDDLWTIPAQHYTSPERARLEAERVLWSEPLIVARSSELPEPGSYREVGVMDQTILLTRQRDGSVVAMANTCRHRGTQLVESGECGNSETFACPYHGWKYRSDGRLARVPHHFDSFVPMEKRVWGLIRYPVAERHGFIWVKLTPGNDTIDLTSYLGDLDGELDAHGLAEWRLARHETFDETMNWKVVADGILDPYHPEFVHPETVGPYINNNVHVFDMLSSHVARLVMSKKSIATADVDRVEGNPSKYLFPNYALMPNTFMVFQSRHFEVWTIEPHPSGDPKRSRTHIRILTKPDGFADEDEHDAYVEQNWRLFMKVAYTEDWGVARRVQAGMNTSVLRDTIVGRNESPVHFFHSFLGERIGDGDDEGLRLLES